MTFKYGMVAALSAGVTAVVTKLIKSRLSKEDEKHDSVNDAAIISDRVTFKLYPAQHHLNKLKRIQRKYGHIAGRGKMYAEMEIDCFFAQIIGAKDSLLTKI